MLNFIKLLMPMSQYLWNALIIQNTLFILSALEQELKIQRTILAQFLVLNKNINIPGILETLRKEDWGHKT